MSRFKSSDSFAWERPIRTFSPRSVPQLWAGLVGSVSTNVVRTHTTLAIEAGKPVFYGPGSPDAAAKALTDWHERVLRRGRMYHFSAALWAHALDCEIDWPEWTPMAADFPTPYGTVVLERPLVVQDQPVSVITYGPGTGWPGALTLNIPRSEAADGISRAAAFDGPEKAGWLISAWSPTTDAERSLGMGPLMNLTETAVMNEYLKIWGTSGFPHSGDQVHNLGRTFKIAFDIATQANIATRRSEPVPRAFRRRAERLSPRADVPAEVFVHDLRPRLAAAIGDRGGEGEAVERADAHYRVTCWPVSPVIDPDTGEMVRRGYIAYRDRTLLEDGLPEPAEVWRGTDLDQPPTASA